MIGINLTIPAQWADEALVKIVEQLQQRNPLEYPAQVYRKTGHPVNDLCALLLLCHYDTSYDEGASSIHITEYLADHLKIERDPVLPALVGIVPEGSSLTFYEADLGPRQIRYSSTEKWIVEGMLRFPEDGRWPFPTVVQGGDA